MQNRVLPRNRQFLTIRELQGQGFSHYIINQMVDKLGELLHEDLLHGEGPGGEGDHGDVLEGGVGVALVILHQAVEEVVARAQIVASITGHLPSGILKLR